MRFGICLLLLCFCTLSGSIYAQQEKPPTHTVQKGETLFSISQQYDVQVSDLKEWNNLTSDQLRPGQVLRLRAPSKEVSQSAQKQQKEESTSRETTSSSSYYTVKSGDTLYEIAKMHKMSLQQLKALNNLTTDNIQIGQRLLVRQPTPTPSVDTRATGSAPQGRFIRHTVKSGENWSDILKTYEMDSVELAQLNPETSPRDLFKGEQITVLKPSSVVYQNPYRIDAQLHRLSTSSVSQYPNNSKGATTTSGELYNPESLTAAHSSIALGSIIYVENPTNRRGLFVKVNDRIDGKKLKLSNRAYELLHFTSGNPSVQIYQRP